MYKKILNMIAYNILNVPVHVPVPALGIEESEFKEKIVAKQQYITPPLQRPTTPPLGSQEYSLTAIDGQGDKINLTDFPTSSFYYGNSIEGV